METLAYFVISITFPYGEQMDDELDEILQDRLSHLYLGFEYFGSETNLSVSEKTSQYSMKAKEINSHMIDDVIYEVSNSPMFAGCEIDWSVMTEEEAEQEGYSF